MTHRSFHLERTLCALAVATATFLAGSKSRAADTAAEEPAKHRIFLGAGPSAAYFQGGMDGHMERSGVFASGWAGYAYRIVRRLELGADVTVFPGEYSAVFPGARIRGYLPVGSGDPVEIGLSGRVALSVLSTSSYTWIGYALSAGPDVRFWLSDDVGLELSGEATAGGGSTSAPESSDYHSKSAGFVSLGGSASVLFRM